MLEGASVPIADIYNKPLGALIPIFLKRSASFIGHTIASTNSSICLSNPPTSVYFSVGFSSTSIALTLLSYSAGNVSNTRYESLLTPIKSPGFNSSGSTRPINGKNMVCRVEVLMTADFPTLVASRSIFAPSSADSAVGSRSSNSTTFPTRYGNCLQNVRIQMAMMICHHNSWTYLLFSIFSRLSFIFSPIADFSCDKR